VGAVALKIAVGVAAGLKENGGPVAAGTARSGDNRESPVGTTGGATIVGTTGTAGARVPIGTALTLTTDKAGSKIMVMVAAAFLRRGRGKLIDAA